MRRTLQVWFDLRGCWRQVCLGPLLLAATLVWIGWNVPQTTGVMGLLIGLLVARSWKRRWGAILAALSKSARGLRRVSDSRIVLYVHPRCERVVSAEALLGRCRRQLDELTKWFGFSLRRRPVVFVYPDRGELQKIYGSRHGGFALPPDAIAVSASGDLDSIVRHELTHLFSRRWNRYPPPLLDEGLATWLGSTNWTTRLETCAQSVLDRRPPKLADLLDPQRFWRIDDQYTSYVLAGSFTGFLLRRYGADQYQRLFRTCIGSRVRQSRFEAAFQRCFGVSLRDAEHRWRVEVLVMPVFEKRLAGGFASGTFIA